MEWFFALCKDLFMRDWLRENLEELYSGVNATIVDASNNIALSPSQWNPTLWSFVSELTRSAIMPIAGVVLVFCLTAEIYKMVVDKNGQHDIETGDIIMLVVKTGIALFVIQNLFTLLLGIFDIGAFAIGQAADVVLTGTPSNSADIDAIMQQLELLSGGQYFSIWMMSCLADNIMWIFNIVITVIIWGRMIEIYLYCSVAAIPAAALLNKDLDIAKNFFKSIIALVLQGFLIMFCLGAYAVLVNNFVYTDNPSTAITQILIYAALLIVTLFKSGGIAKSIMNSH